MRMELETTSTRLETAIRFAQVVHNNEGSTNTERQGALQAAQAEGVTTFDSLRANILLRISNGNTQVVSEWLRQLEFGDFDDNHEAFIVAERRLASAEFNRGLVELQLLREHILQTEDTKSFKHLLPVINEAITEAVLKSVFLEVQVCDER